MEGFESRQVEAWGSDGHHFLRGRCCDLFRHSVSPGRASARACACKLHQQSISFETREVKEDLPTSCMGGPRRYMILARV